MHELSICQNLLDQVTQLVKQHGAGSAAAIWVQIGPLSGVEPALLETAFTFAREGTVAAQASLTLETLPVRIYCPQCQQETTVNPNRLTCPTCDNWQTELRSGNELLLARVELVSEEKSFAD